MIVCGGGAVDVDIACRKGDDVVREMRWATTNRIDSNVNKSGSNRLVLPTDSYTRREGAERVRVMPHRNCFYDRNPLRPPFPTLATISKATARLLLLFISLFAGQTFL